MSDYVKLIKTEFDIFYHDLQIVVSLPVVKFNMVADVKRFALFDLLEMFTHVKGNGINRKTTGISLVYLHFQVISSDNAYIICQNVSGEENG